MWQWLDEEAQPIEMTYAYWRKGEPNGIGGVVDDEHRLQMCKWHDDSATGVEYYGWNDAHQNYTYPFVCEKSIKINAGVIGK